MKEFFKKSIESGDSMECSAFVVSSIEKIIQDAMKSGRNKIIIDANLKLGVVHKCE